MKVKKNRIHILPFVLTLFLLMLMPVSANEDTTRVFDYADLLTEEEEAELGEKCLTIEPGVETELYILTTNDTDGKDTVDYADDFGDEHAFGYDEPYGSYMILCIDMENRMVWLSTSGKAEEYFTEQRIDALLDDLYPALSDGDYYNTCLSYLESGEKYLAEEPDVNSVTTDPDRYQDTVYQYDDEEEPLLSHWYVRLGISVLAGLIAVAVMSWQSGSRMTADERTYSRNGVQVNNRTDAFVRRTTTSRRIETNSSGGSGSGGGGGHHTSSGGHSHGGGGRSF